MLFAHVLLVSDLSRTGFDEARLRRHHTLSFLDLCGPFRGHLYGFGSLGRPASQVASHVWKFG